MNRKEKEGVLLVLLCALIHGAYPILGKYGVSLVPPLLFSAVTNLIAAFSLVLYMIIFKKNHLKQLFNQKTFIHLFFIGLFGTTLSNLLFFYGVRLTSGINSSILLQSEPVYAFVIGYLCLNEKINPKQAYSTLIIILGTLLVIFQGVLTLNWGDILVLITPLCYQIGHLYSKRLLDHQDVSPILIATGRTLYGGISLLILNTSFGFNHFETLTETKTILLLIFYGIIIYALSYYTFYESIRRINLSKATAIISVYPAISILLARFVLKENPDFYQIIGFLVILVGIFYLSNTKSELRDV